MALNVKLVILFIATLFCASKVSADPSWKLCPNAPTGMTINKVTLSMLNRNLQIVMDANVNQQMTSGSKVGIGVSIGGLNIFNENLGMEVGTALPVQGDFTWKYAVSIPSIAPPGGYSVSLTFMNQQGQPLTCIEVDFTISQIQKKVVHKHKQLGDPTWRLCRDAPTDMKINDMKLSLVNRKFSLAMNANVNEQMTNGSQVNLVVRLGGVKVYSRDFDMACGTTLPVQGDFTWSYTDSIPAGVLPGSYSADLTFLDQNNVPMTCVEVDYTLSHMISVAKLSQKPKKNVPSWKMCENSPNIMKIDDMKLSLINRHLDATLIGQVSEEVSQGSKIDLVVYYQDSQIYSQTLDMKSVTNLPIEGKYSLKYSQVLPAIAPSGSYSADLTFIDQNNEPLACVEVDFDLENQRKRHKILGH